MLVGMAKTLSEAQAQKIADTSVWDLIKQELRGGAQKEERVVYPWTDWTDGQWWSVVKGEDFECSASAMRSVLSTHAKRHSMTVKVIKRLDVLVFQFSDNG